MGRRERRDMIPPSPMEYAIGTFMGIVIGVTMAISVGVFFGALGGSLVFGDRMFF